MTSKHFVNLTNGIEAIRHIEGEYSFIRIQSTACEQKRWDFILQELDYNFLVSLALGYECVVYDYGANKPVPRAVYQGLEFVRYVLNLHWFGRETPAYVKGHNAAGYFRLVHAQLEERTLKRLDYFRKFLLADRLNLRVVTDATTHDGDYSWYRSVLEEEGAAVSVG
jgi:hypothetical protein